VGSVDWDAKGGLTLQVLSRDQKDLALLKVDSHQGTTHPLITVHDEAWVNLVPGLVQWLEDGSGFLWATENEAAWQLELRGPDGRLTKILAPDSLGARLGERSSPVFDAPSGRVLFHTSVDPTRSEVRWIDVKTGRSERAGTGEGTSSGVLGPKGLLAVGHSDPRTPQEWSILRSDGTRAGILPSVAEHSPVIPHAEFTRVGTGAGFYVKLVRPQNFDKTKRYPVIASVYGGPTSQVVGQGFYGSLRDQWLADHGFIVVSADGRGTPGRGRSWERAVTNRMAEIPLGEQIAALQALGGKYPELDMNRVGITGWSFGGYLSALAALRRPDVFRAAAAGAPVTDWLDYDTCYTERYLGVPGPGDEVYRRNSLIDDAKTLNCPLLLIHGTTDDNVFFRHSLKLADALFRAGQPFEFLPLSGFTHMVPDPLVKERLEMRIVAFFQSHLGRPQ
jgi:dipeptidyl-peptidase-4